MHAFYGQWVKLLIINVIGCMYLVMKDSNMSLDGYMMQMKLKYVWKNEVVRSRYVAVVLQRHYWREPAIL